MVRLNQIAVLGALLALSACGGEKDGEDGLDDGPERLPGGLLPVGQPVQADIERVLHGVRHLA